MNFIQILLTISETYSTIQGKPKNRKELIQIFFIYISYFTPQT